MFRTTRQTIDAVGQPDAIYADFDARYVDIREAGDVAAPVGFKVYGVKDDGTADSQFLAKYPADHFVVEGKQKRGNSTLDADRGIKAGDLMCFMDAMSGTTVVEIMYVPYNARA